MKNLYFLLLAVILAAFPHNSYSQEWIQIGEVINGEAAEDEAGNSIDISADGNIIAISAWLNDGNGDNAGHVRIFENIEGIWTQIGDDIKGEAGEKKGFAVSLNDAGDIVALSTPYVNGNTGEVSIYKNIDGVWTQMGDDIPGKGQYYYSGVSIDLSPDGNQIAISNHANFGFIRIYNYEDNNWTMTAEISGSLYNEQLGGSGIKFNNNATILAARPSSGTYYPFVRVFRKDTEGNWEQVGDSIPGAGSSFTLNKYGTTVATGNRGYYNGQGYIYENVNDSWIPKGDTIALPMPAVGYSQYTQLSSDGNMLIVSQPGAGAGQVITYHYMDGKWIKSDFELWGENNYDNFGSKLSLSSNDSILAVSAPKNDTGGKDAGQIRIYKPYLCTTINEEISMSVCENELPFIFGEQSLTEDGEYTETYTTIHGCDSIVTLDLTITPTYTDTVSLTASDTEIPYIFGTQSLTATGIYTETFASVNGCDSTVTLDFTVHITGSEIVENENDKVSIYPNPSTGIVNIEVKNQTFKKIHINVYDLNMRLLVSKSYSYNELITLDLSGLARGNYITTITTEKEMIRKKITLK